MSIGCINVPNARLKWMLTLMILAEVCFIMYVKIVNMKNTPDINRIWAMPHSLTFTIKPIRELINRYVKEGMIIIDASDLQAEKQMADSFIKRKKFEKIYNELIVSDAGQTLIVKKQEFEELIKFLFNYRDAD